MARCMSLFEQQAACSSSQAPQAAHGRRTWLHKERARQRHSHAPAAAERLCGAALHLGREGQAGQNGGRARLRAVRVCAQRRVWFGSR